MSNEEQGSTAANTQIRPSLTPSRSAIWRACSSFEQPRGLVEVCSKYRYGRPASAAVRWACAFTVSLSQRAYRPKCLSSTPCRSRNPFSPPGGYSRVRCPLKISRSKQTSLPTTRSWWTISNADTALVPPGGGLLDDTAKSTTTRRTGAGPHLCDNTPRREGRLRRPVTPPLRPRSLRPPPQRPDPSATHSVAAEGCGRKRAGGARRGCGVRVTARGRGGCVEQRSS